jgi:ornithine cyclodeaminase/alanine dehydrogenase-like protein (mu-crystallin family)
MRLLVLSASDVHGLLGYAECASTMRSALVALQSGGAQQPLRTVFRPHGAAGLVGLMPSYLAAPDLGAGDHAAPGAPGAEAAYGLKAVCVTPGNPAAGLDAHQGVVLLSSGQTGEPLALLNASAVTEIRTAAVSVVATELLARPDADVLAVIGAGIQARAHVLALDEARPLREIRLASKRPGRAEQLAVSLRDHVRAPLRACPSALVAVAGAGIVVTATSSAEPVLDAGWLEPGTHINAVGSCLPTARELDTATMAGGVLFADSRESMLAESGDYLLAARDGAVSPAHIRAELGELLSGQAVGRADEGELTIFESLGLAIEDMAASRRAYQMAMQTGAGTWVDI